jgi:hypothetical protein
MCYTIPITEHFAAPRRWHLQSQSAIKLHMRTLSKWVCYHSSQVYNIIITQKSCVTYTIPITEHFATPRRWHLQSQSAIKLHMWTLSKWACYHSSQVYNIIITQKSCVEPFLSPYTSKKRRNKMSQIKTFTHNLNHFSKRTTTSHLDVRQEMSQPLNARQ